MHRHFPFILLMPCTYVVPYYINQRISIKSTISIYEKLSLGSPLRTVRPIPHHNACISLMPINGKDV